MGYHTKPHHYFITLLKKPQHAFQDLAPQEEDLRFCVSYTAYQKLHRKVRILSFLSIGIVIVSATILSLSDSSFPNRSARIGRAASIYYVNIATGNNGNDCLSSNTPCKTIRGALNKVADGDTIQVSAGTYSQATGEPLPISDITKSNLTLTGAGQGQTIIEADANTTHIFTSGGTPINNLTIQGFTFRLSTPITSFLQFFNITNAVIQNNTFIGAGLAGNAIEFKPGSGTISNNIIYGFGENGIFAGDNGSNVIVKNNTIYNNKRGVLIGENNSLSGTGNIRNNVISNNTNGGIFASGIVSVNSTYNNVYNNAGMNWNSVSQGIGDISVDPLYVNAVGGNFAFSACSPSIDAGDPADAYANEPAPNGGRINQGAYGNTASAEISCAGGSRARRDSTPPALPTNVSAHLDASCTVDISWQDPSETDLAEIQILRSQGIYPITSNPYAIITPGIQQYSDNEILFEETYHYILRAKDQTGNVTTDEPIIDVPIYTPEPLHALTIDNISTNSLDVHFSLPSLEKIPQGTVEVWYQKKPFENGDFSDALTYVLSSEEQVSGVWHLTELDPATEYYFAAHISNAGCLFSAFSEISSKTLELPQEETSTGAVSSNTFDEPPQEENPAEIRPEEESPPEPISETESASSPQSITESEPVETPQGGSVLSTPSAEPITLPTSSALPSASVEEETKTVFVEEEVAPEKIIPEIPILVQNTPEKKLLPEKTKKISFFDNPQLEKTAREVLSPSVLFLAAANTVSAAGAFNIFALLQYLFTSPILLFGKKRRAWGVVFNSLSKAPVELAVVRLFSAATHKLIQTRVTDTEGRYQFLVGDGNYYLKVTKPGFVFPTVYLASKNMDQEYTALYHGEIISLEKKDENVIRNIPLDPIQKTLEHAPQLLFESFMRKFQWIISLSGMILAFGVFLFSPTLFMFEMVLLHFFLFLLFLRFSRRRHANYFGVITNLQNQKPVKNAIVRIFETEFDRLLETQLTDSRGRYAFLVGSNTYYLMIEKEGFKQLTTSQMNFEKKKSLKIINKNFDIAPLSLSST